MKNALVAFAVALSAIVTARAQNRAVCRVRLDLPQVQEQYRVIRFPIAHRRSVNSMRELAHRGYVCQERAGLVADAFCMREIPQTEALGGRVMLAAQAIPVELEVVDVGGAMGAEWRLPADAAGGASRNVGVIRTQRGDFLQARIWMAGTGRMGLVESQIPPNEEVELVEVRFEMTCSTPFEETRSPDPNRR